MRGIISREQGREKSGMTQIDIRELLNRKGIAVEFVSNNNLMIKCPFHAGGKERNPSI